MIHLKKITKLALFSGLLLTSSLSDCFSHFSDHDIVSLKGTATTQQLEESSATQGQPTVKNLNFGQPSRLQPFKMKRDGKTIFGMSCTFRTPEILTVLAREESKTLPLGDQVLAIAADKSLTFSERNTKILEAGKQYLGIFKEAGLNVTEESLVMVPHISVNPGVDKDFLRDESLKPLADRQCVCIPNLVLEHASDYAARLVEATNALVQGRPGLLTLQEIEAGLPDLDAAFASAVAPHTNYSWLVAPHKKGIASSCVGIGYDNTRFEALSENPESKLLKDLLVVLVGNSSDTVKSMVVPMRDTRSGQSFLLASIHGDYVKTSLEKGEESARLSLLREALGYAVVAGFDLNLQEALVGRVDKAFAGYNGSYTTLTTPETVLVKDKISGVNPTLDLVARSNSSVLPTVAQLQDLLARANDIVEKEKAVK